MGRRVAVISPLIALMKDQVDGLPPALAPVATLVNSTLESDELEHRLLDIAAGRYKLIYAAPERLRQAPFLHALARAGIDLFVVDEVHCVSIWGHDFRPDYLFIAPALEMIGNPPFLGMTATAGPAMRSEIRGRIGRNLTVTSGGTYRPNLIFHVRHASGDAEKLRTLTRVCRDETGCGIIYVNSRRRTEEIAEHLRQSGIDAGHYHAGMEPAERNAAQEAFMSGRCRVMVATVAFGMGVDKRDVRFVIHYALPKSVENYYQEAGRAGRDGLPSRCTLIYAPQDKAKQTGWMHAQEMQIDQLKNVYHALRGLIPTGGAVHEDDVVRESGMDAMGVRVAVSLLERVGLIRRRLDVPMTLSINLRAITGPPPFVDFVERAHLRRGQRLALELSDLSRRTGLLETEVEPKLLTWRDDGLLYYKGSGRTMFIEMLGGVAGAKASLQEMISEHRKASEEKISRLAAYAKTKHCRHDFIARHFGEPRVKDCRSCDNCSGATAPQKLCDDHLLVLRSLETLPIRLDPKGLSSALSGARRCPIQPHEWPELGVFRAKHDGYAGKVIDDLITWGYLDREGSMLRQVLVLTMAGRRLIHEGSEQ